MSKQKNKHPHEEAQGQALPGEDTDGVPAGEAEPRAEGQAAPEDGATEESMAALVRERDDLLARLQRVSADYLNYQKRVQRDVAATREFANEDLIRALLGVLDDMERALAAGRENHDADDPFVAGMQLVHDKMIETLGRFGLSLIEAEGRPFDPDLHSAMMQQPTEDHPPQTVLTEVVKGYQLRGRTVRPSGVIVAVEPAPRRGSPPAEEFPEDAPAQEGQTP